MSATTVADRFAGSGQATRINDFIAEVGTVGADHRGGWTRLAFSPQERAVHEIFAAHALDTGLRVEVDGIGNSYALPAEGAGDGRTRDGVGPVMIGSHLDTVPQGGAFDGVAGVAVALEVARLLREDHGDQPPHCSAVVFAAEEGARFGMPCIGSRVAAGATSALQLEEITDRDGRSAASHARAVGLDPDHAGPSLTQLRPVAFFEVHIEQGIVLERRERRLGLVESIAGSTRLHLTFEGRADHSGATPMRMRRDALVAAAALVVEVDDLARRHPTSVATVGRLDVQPGSVTTIPGRVELTIDARDNDSERQRELAELLLDCAIRISRRHDLGLRADLMSDQSPVLLHQTLRRKLAGAATALGTRFSVLTSGAMHDAAFVARVAPAALVFVPSDDGVSHSPAEHSDAEDLARAAEVLAAAIVEGL
jgi:allantoate deiminase